MKHYFIIFYKVLATEILFMNKKEVLEIKKQLSPENCSITRIAMAHVTEEKGIDMVESNAFLSLPEEEVFKYFDMYKKTLSGKLGKNLFNISFSKDAIQQQMFMNDLRQSKLEDEDLLMRFYEKVAESYFFSDRYMIVLIHSMYDIPGKTHDGEEQFDASEEVFEYIQCIICPVEISAAALTYDSEKNQVHTRIRDKVLSMPLAGFLYPAFNDRSTDLNEMLYYIKNADLCQDEFTKALTGNIRPMSNKEEAELFQLAVSADSPCPFPVVQNVFERISELELEHDAETKMDLDEVIKLLEFCDMNLESKETARTIIQEKLQNGEKLSLAGMMDVGSFTIKTDLVQVTAIPKYAHRIETKLIDGKLCLVLPLEDSTMIVNGVESDMSKK